MKIGSKEESQEAEGQIDGIIAYLKIQSQGRIETISGGVCWVLLKSANAPETRKTKSSLAMKVAAEGVDIEVMMSQREGS